jgi:hypothetical protein
MFTWIIRVAPAFCLLALAPAAEAGRLKGPASKVFVVQGFHSRTVKVQFRPNEPAAVEVIGDGDAPLAVVILTPDGKRVAADSRNTNRFELRWDARAAQPYQVKVYNRGGVPVRFRLRSN